MILKLFSVKTIKIISVYFSFILLHIICGDLAAQNQTSPDNIKFVRQGVRRFIFDKNQSISLATLNPKEVIGMSAMYPVKHYLDEQAKVSIANNKLSIKSEKETQTGIWFDGFSPMG